MQTDPHKLSENSMQVNLGCGGWWKSIIADWVIVKLADWAIIKLTGSGTTQTLPAGSCSVGFKNLSNGAGTCPANGISRESGEGNSEWGWPVICSLIPAIIPISHLNIPLILCKLHIILLDSSRRIPIHCQMFPYFVERIMYRVNFYHGVMEKAKMWIMYHPIDW